MDEISEPELTLKILGHQWFWSYEIPSLNPSFSIGIDGISLFFIFSIFTKLLFFLRAIASFVSYTIIKHLTIDESVSRIDRNVQPIHEPELVEREEVEEEEPTPSILIVIAGDIQPNSSPGYVPGEDVFEATIEHSREPWELVLPTDLPRVDNSAHDVVMVNDILDRGIMRSRINPQRSWRLRNYISETEGGLYVDVVVGASIQTWASSAFAPGRYYAAYDQPLDTIWSDHLGPPTE